MGTRNVILTIGLFIFLPLNCLFGQTKKLSRKDYIEEYHVLAMQEMLRTGVPASITLAQGMLESDNGNSRLAIKGNNHFGIKCHTTWKGRKIHHNDDRWRECFRKYRTVYDSYIDHSDFLRSSSRYAFLFELEITDYKAWAKGLKKAGYATDRRYHDRLIKIIEDWDLQMYDFLALEQGIPDHFSTPAREEETLAAEASFRQVYERNRIDYVIVKESDTYDKLQNELNLLEFELYRYNELTRDSVLRPGQLLYIQPKRNRAARGNKFHVVREGESMYSISQLYGIKLNKLYKKNLLLPGSVVKVGDTLSLRKKVDGDPLPDLTNSGDEENNEEKIRFEFDPQ